MYQTVKRILLLLCGALLLVIGNISFAMGMTYYAAPYGADNNTGTDANSPWPVQTAVDISVAGDTILLREGVYLLQSTIAIRNTGAPQLPITIKAYQYVDKGLLKSESVMIDAGDSATTQLDSAFRIANLDGSPQYITIENIEIAGGRNYGIVMDTINNKVVKSNIHDAGVGQIKYPDSMQTLVNMEVIDSSAVSTTNQPVAAQSRQKAQSQQTSQTQISTQGNQPVQVSEQDQDEGGGSQNGDSGGGCTVLAGQTDTSLLLLLLFILLYRFATQVRMKRSKN